MWHLSFQGDWGGQQGLLGRAAPTVFRLLILMRAGPSGEERHTLPSGDRSANPATYGVPGRSDLQRAHISVSSARKRSGAEMLATHSGVSRAASSTFSCWCAIPGYQTSRSDYTRGQSPETGSLSRHLAVCEPLPSMSHRVLPCRLWFYQSSLPRIWRGSEDRRLNRRLRLRQSWCPLPRTYEGRPCWGRAEYTTLYGARLSSVPSGDWSANPATYGVPGRSDLQRAHTSVLLPPENVAELRCSPPLRGSLEQVVQLSPAGVPFQDTRLAALITPEASLERLVPLVDYLAAWKLLPSVSPWVLHTVERGYRIQLGSPPPRFNGVNPTLVGPEQALVIEREVEYSWGRRPPRWSLLTKESPGSTAGTS